MGKCMDPGSQPGAAASTRRLQEELADSRLLNDISRELIGEQDLATLYGKLVLAGARLMRAQFASMQMLQVDEHGVAELKLLAHYNFSPEGVRFWDRVQVGEGCSCGTSLARGERVIVPDIEECAFMAGTEDLAQSRREGMRSMQTTPLAARTGEMVGAISTHWDKPHQPSKHQLQLFDILARQAADLIERVRVEAELRANEERFRRALQPENVGVVFFNTEGRITEANNAFLRMSGYEQGDVAAGLLDRDTMTPPEWMESLQRAMAEFRTKGATSPYEKECLRKDGSRWCSLCADTRLSDTEGVEYVIDITDRKRAERALQEADRRKDEFLATLAHELRNPLAPISNATQLLRRPDGRRRADRIIEMVERQVRQLVRLVDDLMEISRITRGKIELEKTRVPLGEILAAAIETSQPIVDEAGHGLTVTLAPDPLPVEADPTRLTQVFANLLNNAARYTQAGGHIWLSTSREGDRAVAVVRDNGMGIAPDRLPHVFEMFAQGHRTAGRGQGGLGIGLTMVRDLVRMHGGTTEVRSAGVGRGTEVIVSLPLAKAQAAALPGAQGLREEPTARLAGRRVLIADDNRDAADSLCMLLSAVGAQATAVYDGPSTLEALERVQPDAVILDIGMPGMDGYEVARRIRADPRFGGVCIVALTGWGQRADRARSLESGIDHHLTKPADMAALEELLGS